MPSKDNRGVLIVEPPSQVRFSGPFTRPVVTTLTLINPTDYKVIFKIKTTAPSFYGVRPNFGVVQPRNFTEVEIARQPFNYDRSEKINHKFMVQSLTVPTNVEDLNKIWENADPSQMNAAKLRCVFDMPTNTMMSHQQQVALSPLPSKVLEERAHNQVVNSTPPPPQTSYSPPTPAAALSPKVSLLETSPQTQKMILKQHGSREMFDAQEETPPNTALKRHESSDNFTKHQLDSLNTEMRQLNIENSVLRKENTMLKDEIEQMRTMTTHTRRDVSLAQYLELDPFSPEQSVPYIYVLTSVSIAVASIFIGKYVL